MNRFFGTALAGVPIASVLALGAGFAYAQKVNDAPLSDERLEPYLDAGSQPVTLDLDGLAARGVRVIGCDLLAEGELIRHDSDKLRRAVLSLALPGWSAGGNR